MFSAIAGRFAATALTTALLATVIIGTPAAASTEVPVEPDVPILVGGPSGRDGLESVRETDDGNFETAGVAGLVTGRVLFTNASFPSPAALGNGVVSLYRTLDGGLTYSFGGFTSTFTMDGSFSISGLPAGAYIAEFIVRESAVPSRLYWPDARTRITAGTFTLTTGSPFNLGIVTVPARSISSGRLSGADRFATAVQISQSMFDRAANPVVYIANGYVPWDALSAGPAAADRGGALLLVEPNSIPPVVEAELDRLQPSGIIIVGGTGVVSSAVQTALQAFTVLPSDVRRLGGADRYATSRAIVVDSFGPTGLDTILLATGNAFPDALSAGPGASISNGAVLLVDGAQTSLPMATQTLIRNLDPETIYLIGGTGAVTDGIGDAAQIARPGAIVRRLAGDSRFETSVEIAVNFFGSADVAVLANGFGFADALAAGPLATRVDGPLYLSESTCVPSVVIEDINGVLANVLLLVGGTSVLSSGVFDRVQC